MADVNDAPVVGRVVDTVAGVPCDPPLQWLDAVDLVAVISRFYDLLKLRRGLLDELNVFPVPDGDTGTNMASTVQAVCESLDGEVPVVDMPAGDMAAVDGAAVDGAAVDRAAGDMQRICHAIAHASLMGARGNSGVILSQILRGVVHAIGATERADGAVMAQALMDGASSAYASVGRPVEGTILTVAREAAEAAVAASNAGAGLSMVMRGARDAAVGAVARSPQLLPVLADAGVVDAGGAGLVLLFDAAVDIIDRRFRVGPDGGNSDVDVDVDVDMEVRWGLNAGRVRVDTANCRPPEPLAPHRSGNASPAAGGLAGGQYEVMFLLHSNQVDAQRMDVFGQAWDAMGDSVVIVGGPGPGGAGLWNCHIHTDDIGAAIEAALEVGRPTQIRVTDLAAQVAGSRQFEQANDVDSGVDADVAVSAGSAVVGAGSTGVATAVVAVANGAGLVDIMRAQGASEVVVGGQGANPSTAQLVAAVHACSAESVVVLPNNPNIVAVANQVADALGDGEPEVIVVPTRSVVAGLAALAVCGPGVTAADNVIAMQAAADAVVAAEVTTAMRASHCDVGPIAVGDWLGISDGVVRAVGDDAAVVMAQLAGELVESHHELVTLFVGRGADDSVTTAVVGVLADVHPQLDVEVHHGGQPLYPYLIGIE